MSKQPTVTVEIDEAIALLDEGRPALAQQKLETARAALESDPQVGEQPRLIGGARTLAEIRAWISERRDHEARNAPERQNTPAAGMTMGALETLDALSAYMNGDDDA